MPDIQPGVELFYDIRGRYIEEPFLSSFSMNEQCPFCRVIVRQVQCTDLTNAKTQAEEEFQNYIVPYIQYFMKIGLRLTDLSVCKKKKGADLCC